jgi:RNA polymerase sigma-70 factor, ECF subfamily
MHVVTSKKKVERPSPRQMAQLSELSEAALLKCARSRHVGAFEELVGRTEVQSYRLAMRYVHNESDAQEILQESYLSAWRSLPAFEGRSQFSSWMHRIVVNTSLMRLRKRNRHPEVAIHKIDVAELNAAIGLAANTSLGRKDLLVRPDEQLQSSELLRRIETAVNCLPQTLKTAFLLRDICEVSTEDSAAKLGVSIPAVKTRLHRARKVLRESLGDYIAC